MNYLVVESLDAVLDHLHALGEARFKCVVIILELSCDEFSHLEIRHVVRLGKVIF